MQIVARTSNNPKATMKEALYFLAIIPDSKTCDDIMSFKEMSANLFASKAALRSPPHITLHMPFKWKESKEEILLQKLSAFQFENFAFKVCLRGFDGFAPKVIFVDVEENELLGQLQKELVTHVRKELYILNADYKDRPFHPHITVAFRDLRKTRFEEAKAHFSAIKYESTFEVNGFHLLKHDGKKWNDYRFFEK
tara:strand:- start:11 stop:595 length:585 start_codon:yes stop_codon:yes gene_type:complete